MNEALHLQKKVEMILRTIRKIHAKHVNLEETRNQIKSLVQDYYREFRPLYVSAAQVETDLANVDLFMKELLRCTQHRTLVERYVRVLNGLSSALHELELKSVAMVSPDISEARDKKILDTLMKLNPSAAASYEQGLMDLKNRDRKSWRGTAVEFREALRELLDTMAPDNDVIAQHGFKLEHNATKPTMKQKAVFILKFRKLSSTQVKVFTDAIDVVDTQVGKFIRSVYKSSSEATHTQMSPDETLRIREYVALALVELLEIRI